MIEQSQFGYGLSISGSDSPPVSAIKASLLRTGFGILLMLYGSWTPAFSVESDPAKSFAEPQETQETSRPNPEKQEQAEFEESFERAQAKVAEREADPETGYIYRLFRDKETPLLGVRWRGDIFLDAPLIDKPEDSDLSLRRGRVTFYKGMGENWKAKLSLEISSGNVELRDNYVEYTGWNTRLARLGIFKEPFSLEYLTVGPGITFMERSLPVTALAPGRSVGAGILRRTETGIFSGGLFLRSPPEDGLGEAGQALGFRYVRSPLLRLENEEENEDAHVGVSFSYRTNAEAEDSRYRTRPETGVTDSHFVDTGEIAGADKILRLGLENFGVKGSFSWQAEIMALQVQRNDFDDVLLKGGYVQVSWFMTGESRNYDAGRGRFMPVKPLAKFGDGGRGSLELTGRISYVDLTDKDIIGGEQSNVTLGLNWKPKDHIRVMANLIKVLDVNRPGSEFDGEDPLILSLRLQWQL